MPKASSGLASSTATLTIRDFASLFGTTSRDIRRRYRQQISPTEFRYRRLRTDERDQLVRYIREKINSGSLTTAGDSGARARWEKGWAGNLREFSRKSYDEAKLVPNYYGKEKAIRLRQDYVSPLEENFELRWSSIFREWLFGKYLRGVDSIYEFGCGSGINLVSIAKLFPDKQLFGLDWASSSQTIINRLSRVYGWKMKGLFFDLFSPDTEFAVTKNSAVLTFSALEQTGRRFEKFLRFLIRKNPSICIHVEPIYEWYDETNLVDQLAMMFHRRRGYLEGFITRLNELESKGKIEILRAKRVYFGSLFTDGYSHVVWRPKSPK